MNQLFTIVGKYISWYDSSELILWSFCSSLHEEITAFYKFLGIPIVIRHVSPFRNEKFYIYGHNSLPVLRIKGKENKSKLISDPNTIIKYNDWKSLFLWLFCIEMSWFNIRIVSWTRMRRIGFNTSTRLWIQQLICLHTVVSPI